MKRAAKRRQKYDSCTSDRISQLPESILIHILCFLSQKKAVQTSVLSKSWRHLGPTRPVIDFRRSCVMCSHGIGMNRFCEHRFKGDNATFISVLENTFQRYQNHNLFPQELCLRMLRADLKSTSLLQKWIPILFTNPALTTFRLSFQSGRHFNLPSVLLKAESLRELCVKWCRFDENISTGDVMLRNLHRLSLTSVEISDEALEKVISGCPLLKGLVLDDCQTINVKGNENRLFNCSDNSCSIENIHINDDETNWYNNHINDYFPHLKCLVLSTLKLSTESFHNFSCNFPCLQELSLLGCYGFEEINLSSRSINRLIIHESVKKVAFDVPNILYFEFSSSYSLPTAFSLTTTSGREWKSHLDLRSYAFRDSHRDRDSDSGSSSSSDDNYDNDEGDVLKRILKLFELVKALSQSQISMHLYAVPYVKIKQLDLNGHPVVVEHLGLDIFPDSHKHFLNALFSIFRPRYTNAVCANPEDYKRVTEFLWKTLIHEREKTKYGWEQHLEEVSIETSKKKGEEWHHVESACLPKLARNEKIRFRMKWRD